MADPNRGRSAAGERPAGTSFADLLDRVRWEYDPKNVPDDGASPLATTERFFRDFPWEGEDPGND